MKSLRARITQVNPRGLTCSIELQELSAESSIHMRDGESSFPEWIQDPLKASFRIEDPKLLDLARSVGNKNVLLSIDEGKVVAIETVREGPVCHFCNVRRFSGEFVHEALCNRIACRKLIKELFEVTRPREKDEMWGGDISGIESRYVYQATSGRREYSPWESPGRHRLLGREFFHVYRAHRAKICTTCEGKQEVWKMPDLQNWLQSEFEHNKRTFNVTGAVITEQTGEMHPVS